MSHFIITRNYAISIKKYGSSRNLGEKLPCVLTRVTLKNSEYIGEIDQLKKLLIRSKGLSCLHRYEAEQHNYLSYPITNWAYI